MRGAASTEKLQAHPNSVPTRREPASRPDNWRPPPYQS